jgi:type II secretory pathway pseudopilin PulG
MRTKKYKSIIGITLVEMLVSVAILTLIVGGGLSVYIMSNRSWREGGVQINLQQKARLAMERMIYGIAEVGTMRNGIIGAEQIQILDYATGTPVNPPSPGDRVDFRLSDAASRNRSFYLDSGRIWYQHGADFSPITPDPVSTGVQVAGLKFISDSNTVLIGISLDMKQEVRGVRSGEDATIRVHLQSSLKKRN